MKANHDDNIARGKQTRILVKASKILNVRIRDKRTEWEREREREQEELKDDLK